MQTIIDGTLTSYLVVNPKANKDALILHGWGHNASLWQQAANQLNPNYRYILLDLPGFGGTQFLPPHPDVPEYTDFITKLIQKLKLKQPIIFGHSFGGQIALDLANKHPDLVSNLVLISPAGIRLKTDKQKLKLTTLKKLNGLKKIIPPFLLKPFLKRLSSTDYLNASPQHKEILKRIVTYDLSTKLPQIKTPTLVIWGELDKEIPYMGQFMADHLPTAKLRVLYGANHNPHLTQINDLTQTINHYFSTL